jgi:hypothetical protein
MTHPPVTPQRRAADRGHLQSLRVWWERWGDLILGAWLICVSIVLLVVAIQFKQSQHATAQAAKTACVRSQQFGPRLVAFLEHGGVFTHTEAQAYRASIPKTCPK